MDPLVVLIEFLNQNAGVMEFLALVSFAPVGFLIWWSKQLQLMWTAGKALRGYGLSAEERERRDAISNELE